jgi:hypothetical protein
MSDLHVPSVAAKSRDSIRSARTRCAQGCKTIAKRQDAPPRDAFVEEREIDQILADSFPASDAPPWTLGVTAFVRENVDANHREVERKKRSE